MKLGGLNEGLTKVPYQLEIAGAVKKDPTTPANSQRIIKEIRRI